MAQGCFARHRPRSLLGRAVRARRTVVSTTESAHRCVSATLRLLVLSLRDLRASQTRVYIRVGQEETRAKGTIRVDSYGYDSEAVIGSDTVKRYLVDRWHVPSTMIAVTYNILERNEPRPGTEVMGLFGLEV